MKQHDANLNAKSNVISNRTKFVFSCNSTLFSNNLSLRSSLNVSCELSHHTKQNASLEFCMTSFLYFWKEIYKTKCLAQNVSNRSLNFFKNRNLILQEHSKVFEFLQSVRVTISKTFILTSSCILISRHEHVLKIMNIYF